MRSDRTLQKTRILGIRTVLTLFFIALLSTGQAQKSGTQAEQAIYEGEVKVLYMDQSRFEALKGVGRIQPKDQGEGYLFEKDGESYLLHTSLDKALSASLEGNVATDKIYLLYYKKVQDKGGNEWKERFELREAEVPDDEERTVRVAEGSIESE